MTIVPPAPSLERLKLAVEYWPSNERLAVWVPSVTVNVPLVGESWVKVSFVAEPKLMSRRSNSSVTPAGDDPKPTIAALNGDPPFNPDP